MDDLRKGSKCKTCSSKSIFYKDTSTKDWSNSNCIICRRGYHSEIFDKIKNYGKRYEKIRKGSDLNFKLACDLRSRTS